MSLRELYQELIIDHGKSPRNSGQLHDASHVQTGHNPLCGDRLIVYLQVTDEVVQAVSFEGEGCAICIASASLMTEAIKQKAIVEIEQLFTHFHQLVTTGQTGANNLGKLEAFAGVADFPIRVKCASLAWHTLKAALKNHCRPVSTE